MNTGNVSKIKGRFHNRKRHAKDKCLARAMKAQGSGRVGSIAQEPVAIRGWLAGDFILDFAHLQL